MKKFVILIAVILLAAGCGGTSTSSTAPTPTPTPHVLQPTQHIKVGGHSLSVATAITPAEQEAGLSNFAHMGTDEGMLFVLISPAKPMFWMKDMKFPLDLIWIRNQVVVDITADLPAPTQNTTIEGLPRYKSAQTVDNILEVNAGWAKAHNIKKGSKVEYE